MQQHHERFMKIALEDAQKAGLEGNVAVGSVIVRDGEVIARGRNLVSTTHDPTAHAETVALREAGAAFKQEEFPGCALYTTFEPCPMCCGAIMASGIAVVVMGGRPGPGQSRWGGYTIEKLIELAGWKGRIEVVTGILTQECNEVRRYER
ncbi:MAG: nucleoside deaminase [Chloroflexi bacterium]|nr:nucleoside deaminase [Chloroflexota bacterium]